MTNVSVKAMAMAREPYVPNVWYRCDICPKCGAKTGEKCLTRTKTYTKARITPHEERPRLPQFQRPRPKS